MMSFQLSHSGEITTLTIRDASREDAGKYVLKAVNCAGTATATISLEVVEITEYVLAVFLLFKSFHLVV